MARALGSYPGCRWFKSDCRYHFYGPLVKRLRHRPFTAESWVRFPYGSPQSLAERSARLLFYVYCRFCLLKRMAVFRKPCKALQFNLRNNLLLCKKSTDLKSQWILIFSSKKSDKGIHNSACRLNTANHQEIGVKQ